MICASLCGGYAQSLNNRVLVVYNTAQANSFSVADYYRVQRAIPAGRLCPVNFGATEEISETAWSATIRPAIRACLDVAGRSNILYVVLSYGTPFRLVRAGVKVAAVDSYVADVWDAYSSTAFPDVPSGSHRYFDDAQSLGSAYAPFLTFASFRAQPRSTLIYSVWRLDGATPAIATGLVDKAIAAENTGWNGNAYIDRRFGPLLENNDAYDLYYFTGEIDLWQAGRLAARAGINVISDLNDAEFGVGTAPNAKFYSGWYSGNTDNDAFTWNPGAIGWHLDSASALNPRQGANWSANALLRGITVTSGSVAEPYLEGLAHPDVVLRHLLHGGNVGDAFLRGTAWLKWMILNIGDPLYRPLPNGVAPFNSPPLYEDVLEFRPQFVITGGAATVNVRLKDAAPPAGLTFNTQYNTPAQVTGPATVTIPAGQRTASFTVNTKDFTLVSAPEIRLYQGSFVLRNTLISVPLLASVQTEKTFIGGAPVSAAVVLYDRAPSGGAVVALSSNHPSIQVPASVTVPFGSRVALFQITGSAVGAATPVTITASYKGANVTVDVTVTP